MPIYHYECEVCTAAFEQIRPVSERNRPVACPDCGSERTRLCIVSIRIGREGKVKHRPRTPAEALAGAGVAGPGTKAGGSRSSVLHACSGPGCRVCGR